ncbi:hypothetical protein C4K03_6215 [Pseudomonas synxantha]|uniref:Uncharacterized protein n=1 Tax=Pseudomonas synxantha TaxID=47883 RepID=A0A3G7UID1_9PSED|nr:hypothetical protein [Pseudomonas synxantha]AZE58322.1 hypothetical protein C4K03_6215 [Pseudomonas synxantha]
MTTPSTTAQAPQPEDLTQKLITQFCVGPSLTEVAGQLLSEALQQAYPNLHINPDTALMGTPVWELADNQILSNPPLYKTLSTQLTSQTLSGVPTLCLEGEHFLTQPPVTEPAIHLPVRIVEVANTINVLAPVMFQALKEKLVEFWNHRNGNGPRWQDFSSTLHKIWNVQRVDDWTDEDCALARTLYRSPDPANRTADDKLKLRACLVDVDLVRGGKITHSHQVPIAVLLGREQNKSVILCHSFDGYRKFSDMSQLGEYLPTLLLLSDQYERLEWRLYEPSGNFFEQLACSMIALQIELSIATSGGKTTTSGEPHVDVLTVTQGQVTPKGPELQWYRESLPAWLATASSSDQVFYSRYLKDLAALNSLNAGKTYQDGIPDIRQYALDRLKAQIIKDHPEAAHLALETLTLKVKSQVVWGLFPVPGQVETSSFSLTDLALQNLIAIPLGNKSLRLGTRHTLPAWLTVQYVEGLITQVDIGTTYPALIRSKLIDDPAEVLRRKTLYAEHLRLQLPLLALQFKIRQQNGLDERGYRYVAAAMQPEISDRYVDGQAIVMRYLGFIPKRRQDNSQDVVTNMYVIGPQNADTGPCLLYRPLFQPVLIQYPSRANLLYAITQSHPLRNSVLAWLPDSVRQDYTNYVFPSELPSPWAVADFLVEPDKLWTFSGPMSLGEQVLNGDLFSTLFEANAKALVELADRQSVSNAESRWATLKQAGWLIFNAGLPFMGRIAGTGAWIWQIVDQVQAFVDAHEHGDQPAQWSALTDVLLNLGMAITLHVASRHPGTKVVTSEPETAKLPAAPPMTVKQLPERTTDHLPAGHELPLHTSGAITRTAGSLATLLDSFKTEKPAKLTDTISEQGAYQHLYLLNQHYYAPVGTRWFEVTLEGDETIVIVDPKQPQRTGPPLIHNAKGEWFIDTRLRLRGGGRKQRLKSAQDKAQAESATLRTKLETFEKNKTAEQRELQQAHQAIADAPGTSAQARRQAYVEKLENLSSSYEDARQQLMLLNVFTPVPDFQRKALGYLKAQLELNEAGIRELLTTFAPKLETVLKQLEKPASAPHASRVEDARLVSKLSGDMIKHLDYAQSRFTELHTLAQDGLRLIQSSKSRLPAYKSDDLRALQVSLARNLCLDPQSFATAPEAWTLIGEIVDSADLVVQALRDTLQERSEKRLDERIESLSSLVEQFQILDERLQDFSADVSTQPLTKQVEGLRKMLRDFADRAIAELAPLHAQQEAQRIRPSPPPIPPRPVKKFINTRYNGVLIGEQRLTPIGLETPFVDIRSPLTGRIIATFREKTKGVWVEHIERGTSSPAAAAASIETSMSKAQALLSQLPAFQTRALEQVNKPSRTPIGVEQMFHQHARLLEQANQAIEEALTQANVTESQQQQSAATLGKQLNDAAQSLYKQANQQVQKLIKQQPPTISGVDWLNNNNLISIRKTVKRRRPESTIKDYVDVYTITDQSTGTALWYAHFHYSSEVAQADRFLTARLKTPEEHAQGTKADQINGLTAQEQVAFYRSTINLSQARRLFFAKESH